MERIIFDRRQSLCCKYDDIFRKYFKCAGKQTSEHEGTYSRLYEKIGISTPHFIRTGFSKNAGAFFNDYRYKNMTVINETDLDEVLLQRILSILNRVAEFKIIPADGINFWNQNYREDITYALNILEKFVAINKNILLQKVYSQKVSVVMHGDFSISNMGLADGELWLFDFESSGCAPACWDLGHFIANLSPDNGKKFYEMSPQNEGLLACIRLAAAVRFGRALKKQTEIEKRKAIFDYWNRLLL